MRIARKVIGRKDQLLVAIPAVVRDHLAVVATAPVYWHVSRKGSVVLTATGRSRGGKPQLSADCPTCAKYRLELDRLRGLLRGAHAGDYNAAFAQGVAHGVKIVPIWRAELDTLHTEVNDLRRLVAQLVVRLPERRTPRRRVAPTPRPVDVIPLPDLPSAPEVVDGGADTSGAAPPGVPL